MIATTGTSIPEKDGHATWSVANFEARRPHMTNWVRSNLAPAIDDGECLRILISAPVKSGKREIVEYVAQRDNCRNPRRVHGFISSWHRTADEEQRKELSNHNLKVYSITSPTKADECIAWIEAQIVAGKQVVLHLDECDFGAGQRQILGRVYTRFRNNESVTFVLYSATPQEVLYSGEVDCDGEKEYTELLQEVFRGIVLEYVPPEGFCGPARFLDEGLVFDAEPFFETMTNRSIRLTSQGRSIMTDLRTTITTDPRRNVVVLRLSSYQKESASGGRKDNKAIYQFLRGLASCDELTDTLVIADKSDTTFGGRRFRTDRIEWSDKDFWRWTTIGVPIIIVIDQTSSRSTEWVCHDRIFAEHDYRNTVVFSTVSQAQERVNHYEQRYGGFQPIRVYGHKKTFELSADRIDYDAYMAKEWGKRKIDYRTASRLGLTVEMYRIYNTITNAAHSTFNTPVSSRDADAILHNLGCHVTVDVSPRVRGRAGNQPVYGCEFMACEPNQFDSKRAELSALIPGGHNFHNPFLTSEARGLEDGKYRGQLRGWKVLDYDRDIKGKDEGWGVSGSGGSARLTVCYRGEVLGIAVRWNTGAIVPVNTLATFGSMYKN